MPRSKKPRELITNQLLAALSQKEYQRLQPQLEQVALVFGDILYEPGDVIDYVYFVNQGIVSLLSIVEGRSPLEVGMVGSEGMVGIGVFLGARTSLNRALVQRSPNSALDAEKGTERISAYYVENRRK